MHTKESSLFCFFETQENKLKQMAENTIKIIQCLTFFQTYCAYFFWCTLIKQAYQESLLNKKKLTSAQTC